MAVAGTTIHELGHSLCLGRVGQATPASCQYDGIDVNGPNTYVSSMNYVYQFDLVNYSTGPNGVPPADFNDWGAILLNSVSEVRHGTDAPGASEPPGLGARRP